MHTYVYAYMHAWAYEQLGACTCVFKCELMCARSIEVSIACFVPPPPPNIEKLPTHISQAAVLGHHLKHKIIFLSFLKVRKDAKIRNGYTQVPHLTKDTPSESDKTQ